MTYVPMTDDELFHVVRNHATGSVEELRAIERAVLARLSKAILPIIQSQQYNDEVYRDTP
jgi:hypothetical protein